MGYWDVQEIDFRVSHDWAELHFLLCSVPHNMH